ncbi:hypothetical protein ACSS7Z_04395 [Microbacterium sp. A82]|uniref:hypothetical protein n=1 Tax=Microbacterium sp. A82 TaxID=3450452 RepID=UPI003F4085C1
MNEEPAALALALSGRVRVILVGIVAPILLVTVTWLITSSWRDLPAEIPSHWSGNTADSFLQPEAVINAWTFGGIFVALMTVSVTIGCVQRWQWTPLGRGVSAVGVGATAAVAVGLFFQLILARGKTTEEVIALGAGPSILAIMGGFALVTVLALLALPKGQHPPTERPE